MATTPEIAVFIFCMIGCAFQSFYLGYNKGIHNTLDYMVDQGIIEDTEEE